MNALASYDGGMGAPTSRWLFLAGIVAGVAAVLAVVVMLRSGGDGEGRREAGEADEIEAPPPTRELPAPPPPPPAVAVLRGRIGPGGPVLTMADPGPVAKAVEFLLSCQGEDGLFHAALATLDEDPKPEGGHDIALSGWVALALLDAVDVEDASAGAVGLRRALDALAREVRPLSAAAPPDIRDVEGLILASWALAAGYGRTANAAWKESLPAAVARVLSRKDSSGGWRLATSSVEDDLMLTFEVMGLVAVAQPMRATFPDAAALDDAFEGAGEWALSVSESPRAPFRGPGVVALEFLLRLTDGSYPPAATAGPELVTGPPPLSALDHATVLLGSVLRFPRGGKVAIEWNRDVLEPAATKQRGSGRGAGSWDGNDARSRRYGRLYATALETLAWLFPRVPFRAPRGS